MNTTVTLKVRSLVVTGAATLAVLAAYVVGSTQAGTSTAAEAQDPKSADVPGIVMTGQGEATGVPDQLTFSLEVHTSAIDVSTAFASANRATHHVLKAVRLQSVARRDVQTTGISINPMYDYNVDGPAVITGYAVSESMSVLVRSLPDAGDTISAAVSAGGNAVRLHGVRLQIGDEEGLLRQARADAIEEAQAKAEQYAEATGRELGEVTSIREVHASSDVPQVFNTAAQEAGFIEPVRIRAGSADLHITVSVVWTFA